MSAFDTLTELFKSFPGIGPRQARRFADYLARSPRSYNSELAKAIESIKKEMKECTSCHRFFTGMKTECNICSDTGRDRSKIAVVAYDNELEALERSKIYTGLYFVLGGLVPIVEAESHIRERELLDTVTKRKDSLTEVILALSVTAEGDHTADHLRSVITPLLVGSAIKITTLGRGVSTGSELEYADRETIKNALEGRK